MNRIPLVLVLCCLWARFVQADPGPVLVLAGRAHVQRSEALPNDVYTQSVDRRYILLDFYLLRVQQIEVTYRYDLKHYRVLPVLDLRSNPIPRPHGFGVVFHHLSDSGTDVNLRRYWFQLVAGGTSFALTTHEVVGLTDLGGSKSWLIDETGTFRIDRELNLDTFENSQFLDRARQRVIAHLEKQGYTPAP